MAPGTPRRHSPGVMTAIRVHDLRKRYDGVETALGSSGHTCLRPGDLAALLICVLWGAVFAVRHFSWVPRGSSA
jgi:hypothetical protein